MGSRTMVLHKATTGFMFIYLVLLPSFDAYDSKEVKILDNKEDAEVSDSFQERNMQEFKSTEQITKRLGMSSRLTDMRKRILQRLNSNEKISIAFPVLLLSVIFLLIVEMILGT